MRIRTVLSGSSPPVNAQTTLDTGRTYAGMLTRWSERLVYRVLPNNTQQSILGIAGATNGIQVGYATPTIFGNYEVVVMDVSNY